MIIIAGFKNSEKEKNIWYNKPNEGKDFNFKNLFILNNKVNRSKTITQIKLNK